MKIEACKAKLTESQIFPPDPDLTINHWIDLVFLMKIRSTKEYY